MFPLALKWLSICEHTYLQPRYELYSHERKQLLLSHFSRVRLYRPHGLQPTRLLHPWDFPGKSTGVGCHCLLRILRLLSPIKVLKNLCLRKLSASERSSIYPASTGPLTPTPSRLSVGFLSSRLILPLGFSSTYFRLF